MSKKVIVANETELKNKYGDITAIRDAVGRMVTRDAARGIQSELVNLDDGQQMGALGAPTVTIAANEKQNKDAIDGVFRATTPDYLLILGSVDSIPHQDLENPVLADSDPDRVAFSDLPYACDPPYSKDVRDFLSPSRVVGRLPDLTGSNDPAYLPALLDTASSATSRDLQDYQKYFALSTDAWKGSTKKSVTNIFGNAKRLRLAPPKGPSWRRRQLAPLSHFINCHGALADPTLYGDLDGVMPEALIAPRILDRLAEGTVAAVESCYGAELYDPLFAGGHRSMCNSYLQSGAYGYFGSTTIAYGPADGNGAADLITQYFLMDVLEGASIGRAALQAHQKYISTQGPDLDNVDLKTLAQYILLGDPSIHPVKHAPDAVSELEIAEAGIDSDLDSSTQRALRRQRLAAAGKALPAQTGYSRRERGEPPSPQVQTILRSLARRLKIEETHQESFDIDGGEVFLEAAKSFGKPERIHMIFGRKAGTKAGLEAVPFQPFSVIIARERNNRIVAAVEYHRK